MNEYFNMYFNSLYLENKEKIGKLTDNITHYLNSIKRIKQSSNSYVNDDAIIKEKEKRVKQLRQKRSRVRKNQKMLTNLVLTEQELNLVMFTLNREIASEVIKGGYYKFPYAMGYIHLKFVKNIKNLYFINWGKSIENHLKLTKKYAPVIHKQYINKEITKRRYFHLAKPFVHPRVYSRMWLVYEKRRDLFFMRWYPNHGFFKKNDIYYRFIFTKYNITKEKEDLTDYKTVTLLKKLDTEDKIIYNDYLGNTTKLLLVQTLNPDYKHKLLNYGL